MFVLIEQIISHVLEECDAFFRMTDGRHGDWADQQTGTESP